MRKITELLWHIVIGGVIGLFAGICVFCGVMAVVGFWRWVLGTAVVFSIFWLEDFPSSLLGRFVWLIQHLSMCALLVGIVIFLTTMGEFYVTWLPHWLLFALVGTVLGGGLGLVEWLRYGTVSEQFERIEHWYRDTTRW